jgi:hypothetical protein
VSVVVRRAAALVALAVSAGLASSAPAGAAVDPVRTITNPSAKLGDAGRTVRVTGQVTCAACTRLTLAVTISQRSGALAQGGVRCVCRATTERWTITARIRETARLHAGRARICTWVMARGAKDRPIDAYQWCRDVTLA